MSVAAFVLACGERTQGLVTPRMLAAAGLSSGQVSRATRAGELVRVRAGVYASVDLAPLPRLIVTDEGVAPAYVAHVRAVLLSLGPQSTACLRTAAALRGWGLLVEPSRTVEVAVAHGRSRARSRQVRIRQRRRLAREQLTVLLDTDALWVTGAVETVLDCAAELPAVEAVVIGDSALRSGQVTLEELRRAATRRPGVREAARVRRVLDLLDPEAGSVLESVLRFRLVQAGVEGFTTQFELRQGSRALLRVDFCFHDARLVVEADGAKWHVDPSPDRQRDNLLARRGYRVLRYTWAEIVHDDERVVHEIREACAFRGDDFQFPSALGELAA